MTGTIKIYIGPELNPLLEYNPHHDFPFVLEKNRYTFVDKPEDSDIIPVIVHNNENRTFGKQLEYIGPCIKDKHIILMMHTHGAEINDQRAWNLNHKKNWIQYCKKVHIVDINMANTDEICYQYHFNLEKAYYLDNFDFKNRLHIGRWATKKMFALDSLLDLSISQPPMIQKKFIVMGRVRDGDVSLRNQFRREILSLANDEDCYWSNWDSNSPDLLMPEDPVYRSKQYFYENFVGWHPIANRYFRSSFVSVFVETIVDSSKEKTSILSEKSFDPLIKGHFILPFGFKGIIEELVNFGFKFPDWIDYEYDTIDETRLRFQVFKKSFQKLRSMDYNTLIKLYQRDRYILEYNRSIFYNKSYDSLYDKIKQRIF